MGGAQSNLVNLLPALPGLALGIAMLVLAPMILQLGQFF